MDRVFCFEEGMRKEVREKKCEGLGNPPLIKDIVYNNAHKKAGSLD